MHLDFPGYVCFICLVKVRKRDLADNLQLRKGDEEITVKTKQILREEEKLGGLDANNLTLERNSLQKEYDKLHREVGNYSSDLDLLVCNMRIK